MLKHLPYNEKARDAISAAHTYLIHNYSQNDYYIAKIQGLYNLTHFHYFLL